MLELNTPYGSELKNLFIEKESIDVSQLLSLDLNQRQLCDIELLCCGAFSPLTGFLNHDDYMSVVTDMRLVDGTLWPIPIVLDVSEEFAASITNAVALRDEEGVVVAVLEVESIYRPNYALECQQIYGTHDESHPGVTYLKQQQKPVCLGGALKALSAVEHYDFKHLRNTPEQLREKFKRLGWNQVTAFHTHHPMYNAQIALATRAAQDNMTNLLLHPITGMSNQVDITYYGRVRCYEQALKHCPEQTTCLSLLPLATRLAGSREALLHAIVCKNYGCSHIIIDHDLAAQDLLEQHQDEIGVAMLAQPQMVYVKELCEYKRADEVTNQQTVMTISSTELKHRLEQDLAIDEWFCPRAISTELKKIYPPLNRQGFTVFFTGLSGSGKSTIANALQVKLLERGGRSVTLLDGDIVRRNLSSELGFSKKDRSLNIRRIGYVAAEISKNFGCAICAPIAPYEIDRKFVRTLIEQNQGKFIEVYVATPIEECERRDRKGLYAKARKGLIKEFTGINDPYEVPQNADIVVDTMSLTPDQSAHMILLQLEKIGLL